MYCWWGSHLGRGLVTVELGVKKFGGTCSVPLSLHFLLLLHLVDITARLDNKSLYASEKDTLFKTNQH